MSEAIIVALITAGAGVICQVIISYNSNRKKKEDDAVRDAILEQRLRSVEQKLDEHNHYASRLSEMEKAIVRIETKLEKEN